MGRSTFGTATRQPGAELVSPDERFAFPIDAKTIRAVVDIPASVMTDAGTDVEAIIEWAPDGTNFIFLCSARLQGRPGNSTNVQPFVEPDAATTARIVREHIPVRGRIVFHKRLVNGGGSFEVTDQVLDLPVAR